MFHLKHGSRLFEAKCKLRALHRCLSKLCTMALARKVFVGPIAHTSDNGDLITIDRAAIFVEHGKISKIIRNPDSVEGFENVTVLEPGQFLLPGFVDGHVHAVQFPNLGVGYDKTLLEWLETYTFPLERKYKDTKFAILVFDNVVRRTLSLGTTTACYFASLYAKSSVILGQKAAELGQRAFIGKINMNVPRKDGYYETTEDSIKNVEEFIEDINAIGCPLVKPVITPRFALSCSNELMKKLGQIAKEKDLHIQSHISENLDEIEAVKQSFEHCPSYTAVYDEAGLLTNKTVLAHGVHLTDSEMALLKKNGTAIIHCPSSNTCLRSGLCDVQRLKENGITVGLGTDVAGGQSCSILDAMRSALQVSCHLSFVRNNYDPLTYKHVLHMATLGGAKALAIDNVVGNFVPGKEFDALVIDASIGLLDDFLSHTLEEKVQRFIYSGDDRNIVEVYVSGRKVK